MGKGPPRSRMEMPCLATGEAEDHFLRHLSARREGDRILENAQSVFAHIVGYQRVLSRRVTCLAVFYE